jgi:hypothetical protein
MQLPNAQNPYPPMQPPPPRERKRFGAFSALVLSFFSAELYRDVGRRWRGIGFWYLALLMLITAVPDAIKAHIGFGKFVKDDAQSVISTFPTITIKNHKASIAEPEPYLWREPKGQVLLYVDTTGKFDLPAGQNALAKLSDTQLFLKKSTSETTVYALAQFPDFSVDKNDLGRWLDVSTHWVGAVVFGFLFIFPFIGHFFQILIYGLFGMVFCAMFNAKLDYAALLRLSAVAITPAVLIATALDLTGVNIPAAGWIYFGIEMLFLGIAVKANASGQATPPGGFPVGYAPPPVGYASPQAPGGYGQPPAGYAPPPPGQYPPPQR